MFKKTTYLFVENLLQKYLITMKHIICYNVDNTETYYNTIYTDDNTKNISNNTIYTANISEDIDDMTLFYSYLQRLFLKKYLCHQKKSNIYRQS